MSGKEKIYYGWWVVAATFMVLFIGLCSAFYTVSVFLEPLQEAFRWTKTQISLGFTIAALLVGLLSPVVGLAVSRLGVKKVYTFGALAVSAGLLLLSFITQLWQYYALYVLIAAGIASMGLVPSQTIASHWFERKRGLAMGIIMTGIGLGGMFMVFVASQAVESFGWRGAFRLLAGMVFCIVLPVIAILIKNKPADIGLEVDGGTASQEEVRRQAAAVSLTVSQAVKTLLFPVMCAMMVLFSIILGGMTQHAIAMLRSVVLDQANLYWSLALGASVVGRLLFGGLADRFPKKILMIVILVFQLAGVGGLFLMHDQSGMAWSFVVCYGMALGAFPTVFAVLMGEGFGVEHFSKLVGLTGLFQILGLSAGAVIPGRIFDTTGSYVGAIKIMVILAVIAIGVSLFIRKPAGPTAPRHA